MNTCERWHTFELVLDGPTSGNPFVDVHFSAVFSSQDSSIQVNGFYDGSGKYKVRFMPEQIGTWTVKTISNVAKLNDFHTSFTCTPALGHNHGPVRVAKDATHFEYADGTPYLPFGTTAYAWVFQSDATQKQTLDSLKNSHFNKIRMTVFPKYYSYNTTEPAQYPFAGHPTHTTGVFDEQSWQVDPQKTGFDFSTFNPSYFQHLEQRIKDLDALGIEADLILFHPYDSWGFARMGKAMDQHYIQYIVARLASFKNVWWSLANEFDLMDQLGQKPLAAWNEIGERVHKEDPSNHLLSIHNFYDPPVHKGTTSNWFDYTKPWITHLSIQSDNVFFAPHWLKKYNKPVIFDECRYEGKLEFGWGDNSAHGMIDNVYRIVLRGGYATHGETYIDKPNTKRPIWWAHGGILRGKSPKRISYLQKLLANNGFTYIIPLALQGPHWELAVGASPDHSHILAYLGENQPEFELFDFLPQNSSYTAQLIDVWNMTMSDLNVTVDNKHFFHIPRKPYQAILLTKTN